MAPQAGQEVDGAKAACSQENTKTRMMKGKMTDRRSRKKNLRTAEMKGPEANQHQRYHNMIECHSELIFHILETYLFPILLNHS